MKIQTRNKIKRVIPFVLAMAMIFGVIASAVGTMAAGAIDVANATTLEIIAKNIESVYDPNRGQSVNITLDLKKQHEEKITLTSLEVTPPDNSGISINKDELKKFENIEINSQTSKSISFNADLDKSISTGDYTLGIIVKYKKEGDENTLESRKDVTLKILPGNYRLSAVQSRIPTLDQSQKAEYVTFYLKNPTNLKAIITSVEVADTSDSGFTVDENKILNDLLEKTIAPGNNDGPYRLYINFIDKVDSSITHEVKLRLYYKDADQYDDVFIRFRVSGNSGGSSKPPDTSGSTGSDDISSNSYNYVRVEQSIQDISYTKSNFTLSFTLINISDSTINIESITGFTPSSSGFTVLENDIRIGNKGYITDISLDDDEESERIRIPLSIDRSIKRGTYWVEMIVNYDDGYSEKIKVYFRVKNEYKESTDESDVTFKPQMDIHVPKDSIVEIKSGDEFLLTVLLDYDRHVINEEISSLTVTSESFDVSDGMETRILDKINDKYTGSEAYQKAAFYRLQTKKDLKSGRYPISMKVDYVDEDGKEYSVTNRYTVYVIGEDEDEDGKKTSSATPFIIIEEYDYGGGNVVAGDSFELKFTFFNTSTYIPLENILVTVTTPEDLSLTSSSNTFFIPSLAPQERMSKMIQVTAKAAAKPSSPSINIKFKYEYLEPSRDDTEDKRVSDKTSEENIAVPLIQKDRFEVGDVEPPMQMFVGEENSISVEFVNKGTNDVRNITASITGNIQNPGQSQYIGNLISGEQNSADFYITAMEPGEVKGQIIITYEDSNGSSKEIKKDYTIPVIEMTFPDENEMAGMMDPSLMGEEENKGLPFLAWVGIIAGALVIAAVILIIVLKKIKKKKQEAEDETL